ncbi:MAG: FAD-dependent oxidoreductase [Alphaproteobacteria bacterium]|nr:MAG: FAD-dependent oxidoreductase [Alphaproteobacteria bacterium]
MRKYDVLVIGGGLVGCASAFYLARRGANVLLAEKNDINSLASGQNAGSLHFQLEHRLIQQGDALAEQFSRIIALNRMAVEQWTGLEAELGEPVGLAMKGGFMVAMTSDEVALLKNKHSLEQSCGMDTQLLTAEETLQIAPYLNKKILAAAYLPQEGHANPRLVTPAYARAAAKQGVTLQSHCEVTYISRNRKGWQVRLGTGEKEEIEVDMILNAAGAWAGQSALLAGIHLPVLPLALMMSVTEATPPFLPHLLQRAGAELSLKQVNAGNILIGGGWAARFKYNHGQPDLARRPAIIMENVVQNLILAAELVPEVARLHLLRCWTGIVGVIDDQLPLLGEVPGFPGYYVATGGSGFTLGPLYARLISELMTTGGTSHDISPYNPGRFGQHNSSVAKA